MLVVTALSLLTLGIVALSGSRLESTLLLVTGAFTLVYVVGTAAAIRLLPSRTWVWRCAVVSFVATLGLLWMTGVHLFAALGIVAVALAWSFRRAPQAS